MKNLTRSYAIFKPQLSIEEAQQIAIYLCDKKTQFEPRLRKKLLHEFFPTIVLAKKLQATAISLIENESLHYDAELHYNGVEKQVIEWVSAAPHEEISIKKDN